MEKLNVNFSGSISKFESAMRRRFLVKTIFYRRVFRGKGPEFESYRLYSPDDDASLIDWKATMRAGRPMVKQYVEERGLKIFFIIDVGDNMVFGSGSKLKNETAAEIAASLAHLIISSGDSIGFSLYSDRLVKLRPLKKGIKQFYLFAKELANPENYGGKSDLKQTIKNLEPYMNDVSAVFIISDFIKVDAEFQEILKKVSYRYETIGIMVRDSVDMKLPDMNREIIVEDNYTGRQLLINPSVIKFEYEKYAAEQKKKVEKIFKESNADLFCGYTNEDFVGPLVSFLNSRVKKRRAIMPKR